MIIDHFNTRKIYMNFQDEASVYGGKKTIDVFSNLAIEILNSNNVDKIDFLENIFVKNDVLEKHLKQIKNSKSNLSAFKILYLSRKEIDDQAKNLAHLAFEYQREDVNPIIIGRQVRQIKAGIETDLTKLRKEANNIEKIENERKKLGFREEKLQKEIKEIETNITNLRSKLEEKQQQQLEDASIITEDEREALDREQNVLTEKNENLKSLKQEIEKIENDIQIKKNSFDRESIRLKERSGQLSRATKEDIKKKSANKYWITSGEKDCKQNETINKCVKEAYQVTRKNLILNGLSDVINFDHQLFQDSRLQGFFVNMLFLDDKTILREGWKQLDSFTYQYVFKSKIGFKNEVEYDLQKHIVSSWNIDNKKPSPIDVYPKKGGIVDIDLKEIRITFDDVMYPPSINETTFLVNSGQVEGEILIDRKKSFQQSFIFRLSSQLDHSTVYTIQIKGHVEDIAGNAMGTEDSWNFQTKNPPDVAITSTESSDSKGGFIFIFFVVIVGLVIYSASESKKKK